MIRLKDNLGRAAAYQKSFPRALAILLIGCGLALFERHDVAQSVRGRASREEFGSSLKRLKWDSQKGRAREIKGDAGAGQGTDDGIERVETRLAVCEVDVYDPKTKKYSVRGLTRDDFVVAADDQPQQIAHFSRGDDPGVPRSVVLVIDYSASQLPVIDRSIDAAEILVDQLGPGDRMAIVTDDVALLSDFTTDKASLKNALESLRKAATSERRFGRSDQYSALLAAARELFTERDVRRIIIFQTDGDELRFLQPPDRDSLRSERFRARVKEYGINDVYDGVEKSRATVHGVFTGPPFGELSASQRLKAAKVVLGSWDWTDQPGGDTDHPPSPSKAISKDRLSSFVKDRLTEQIAIQRVAALTGGVTSPFVAGLEPFYPRPYRRLNNAETIAYVYESMLRGHYYAIGFYPTNRLPDGRRHDVSIRVRNHPEYVVTGRHFYYAPSPEE